MDETLLTGKTMKLGLDQLLICKQLLSKHAKVLCCGIMFSGRLLQSSH
jgi:hypothetical protein